MIFLDVGVGRQGERRAGPVAGSPARVLGVALRDPWLRAATGAGVALWIGVSGWAHDVRGRLDTLRAEVAAAEAEAVGLAEAKRRSAELAAERQRLEKRVGEFRSLESDPYGGVRLMAAAAVRLPPAVWLQSVEEEAPDAATGEVRFRIRGFAPGQGEAVGAYAKALVEEGAARDARLGGVSAVRIGSFPLLRFEVVGTVADRAPGGQSAKADRPGYGGAGASYTSAGEN
ncbi:MAG: hypothetical protein AB1941_05020 [Gemmatimonadota bacterium]